MSDKIFGTSLRGWRNVILWTIGGTSGCILFSVLFNSAVFAEMPDQAYRLGILVAIVLPTLLAGPLFFYLTLKMRELARANYKLHILATEDSLTGLSNRSAMIDAVQERSEICANSAKKTTDLFVVVDADHFKKINDLFGHAEGDRALRLIAHSLRDGVRKNDVAGRIGGEEFALLLVDVTINDAIYIVDRLRRAISAISYKPNGIRYDLSVSLGGVVHDGKKSFAQLFKAADTNLYQAKADGRNCSVVTNFGGHFNPMKRAEDLPTVQDILHGEDLAKNQICPVERPMKQAM